MESMGRVTIICMESSTIVHRRSLISEGCNITSRSIAWTERSFGSDNQGFAVGRRFYLDVQPFAQDTDMTQGMIEL